MLIGFDLLHEILTSSLCFISDVPISCINGGTGDKPAGSGKVGKTVGKAFENREKSLSVNTDLYGRK